MTNKQLEEFAHRLIRFRVKYKISQADFAKLSGLSQPTVSHIEQGTFRPTLKTMSKVEKAIEEIKCQNDLAYAEHYRRVEMIRNL